MNKGFTVEAVLTRVASMVDGGLSLGLQTKELNATEKAEIMDYHNKAGWLLFKENSIEDEDIPKSDAEVDLKTPSQRLRAVLYVYCQQQGIPDFDSFYRAEMEKIINGYKNKLE